MRAFSTRGSVRGGCGHRHRTPEAAGRCAREDQQGCKRQGGYSDRVLVIVGVSPADPAFSPTEEEADVFAGARAGEL